MARTSSQWKDPSCVPINMASWGTSVKLLITLQFFNDSIKKDVMFEPITEHALESLGFLIGDEQIIENCANM
jgi:hypothetical protein